MAKKPSEGQTQQAVLDALEAELDLDVSDLEELSEKVDTVSKEVAGSNTNVGQSDAGDQPESQPPLPANDSHDAELANLIYDYQKQPGSLVFPVAVVISLAWIAVAAFFGYPILVGDRPLFSENTSLLSDRAFWSLAALCLLPLFPIWGCAYFLRRAQEMRYAARNMTEAAIRLLRPEKVSTDAIANVGMAVRREVAAIGEGVELAYARAFELENLVQREVMSLERSYGDSEVRLKRLIADLTNEREQVVSHADKLRTAISNTQNNFISDIESTSAFLEEQVKGIANSFGTSLVEKGDAINLQMSTQSSQLAGILDEAKSRLLAGVDKAREDLNGDISMRTEKLQSVLSEQSTAISSTLDQNSDMLKKMIGEADETIMLRSSDLESTLSKQASALNVLLTDQTEKISTSIDNQSVDLRKAAVEFVESVDDRREKIDKVFDARTKAITDTIHERSVQVATVLADGANKFNDEIDIRSNNAIRSIDQNIETLNAKLSDSSTDLGQIFEKGAVNLSARLSDGQAKFTEVIEKTVDNAGSTIDNKAEAITEVFSKRAKAIEESIGEAGTALDEKAQAISDVLGKRAKAIHDDLGQGLINTQQSIEDKTKELNELLSNRTLELSSTLAKGSETLINTIDEKAAPVADKILNVGEKVVENLVMVSGKIGAEASSVLNDLNERSLELDTLFTNTSKNLDLLHTQLAAQTANLTASARSAADDINMAHDKLAESENSLETLSRTINDDLAVIAGRLGDQTDLMHSAADVIQTTQANLHASLEEKQSALETVMGSLASQGQDVDDTLRVFTKTIENLAHEISKNSKSASFEVAQNISTAIDDATARFGDTVVAMRDAADVIRTELDDTREQMRRGVLELPDETHQNASAMRRVVTDQIAALRDLAAIVEKSGKMLDSATPALAAQSAAQSAVRKPDPQPAKPIAPSRPAPAISSPAQTSSRRQTQFPPQTRAPSSAPSRAPQPRAAQATRPTSNAPRSRPPAPSRNVDGDAGWVSDLLRRASEDDQVFGAPQPDPRQPHQVVDSLNSLSMDIANAIDHDTAADLWERYQRGETNVFTRRLYTLQGQQTFDEIRAKYSQDADFSEAVDRYIDDFERLLGDAHAGDPSGQTTRSYLSADTGKVYTMLAHASGRLGS